MSSRGIATLWRSANFVKAIKEIAAWIVKLLVVLATLKHSHMLQRNFKVLVHWKNKFKALLFGRLRVSDDVRVHATWTYSTHYNMDGPICESGHNYEKLQNYCTCTIINHTSYSEVMKAKLYITVFKKIIESVSKPPALSSRKQALKRYKKCLKR